MQTEATSIIQKRHVILNVILVVALTLAVSVAYSASWNHIETWTFNLNSKAWNLVESWTFTLNSTASWNIVEPWNFQLTSETLSWNHADVETTTVTAYRDWLPILASVLIMFFSLTVLVTVIYAKRKAQKRSGEN